MVSSFMTSFCTLFLLLLSFAPSHSVSLETSTISAAPALLPDSPLPSPTQVLSPDIMPLFPSPKGVSPSPADDSSTTPTIPSTLSPPNPDEMVSYGPDTANPPSPSMPGMSSASFRLAESLNSAWLVGLVVVYLLQLFSQW